MLELRFTIDGHQRIVPLSAPEIRFGRSSDNEVVLPDYSVSRRHATVRREDDTWTIYDLGSTNGVQINQESVDSSPIRAGDVLKIGVFELRVEDSSAGRRPARPAAPDGDSRPVRDFTSPRVDPQMPERPTVPADSGVHPLEPAGLTAPPAGSRG